MAAEPEVRSIRSRSGKYGSVMRGSSGSSALAGASGRPPFPLIVAITITGIMANTLVTPAAPDIVADFGVGPSGVGLLLAAATAPGILLAPVIGVLADRLGRRETVVPCLVIFGLGGGLVPLAPSFAAVIALRVVQGVGSAGLINLAVVIIGDHWDGVERARMIGRNAASLTASIAVLPPLGGFLADLGGWEATFLPYWLALVTAGLVLRMLPAGERGDRTLGDQLREVVPYLRSRTVVGATGIAFVLFVMIFGLFLTALPVHLAADFGVGASGRGLILGLPAVTSTVMALNAGRLRSRAGLRPVLGVGFVALAAGLAVLGAAEVLWLLLVAPLLYGVAEGLLIPSLQDVVAGAAPATSRGSVVAVFVSFTRLGQTAGPLAAGYGLEAGPAEALFWAGAGLAVLLLVGHWLLTRGSRAGELAPS